jgi:putative peptidoglycan lipid II flippase
VATALVWWSISLPFQGVSLLFSRTFFSLQRPWETVALSLANLLINAGLSAALYKPYGIGGIVIGTVAGTIVMCVSQGWILRRSLRGVEGRAMVASGVRMLAASALLAGVAYGAWYGLDDLLGRAFLAQVVSVGLGIAAGGVVYIAAVWAMGVPEMRQIRTLLPGRG